MVGFEGHGDFDSDDPYERYIAHQAAKGRSIPPPLDIDRDRQGDVDTDDGPKRGAQDAPGSGVSQSLFANQQRKEKA